MASALVSFSVTEEDSAWQNLYALNRVTHPRLRAKMFQHVLEEMHHGALFRALALKYSDQLLPAPAGERDPIFSGKTETEALRTFFSYELVGEWSVKDLFHAYALAAPFEDIREVFLGIQKDERGHYVYTADTLKSIVHSRFERQVLVAGIQLRRLGGSLGRISSFSGVVVSTVVLSAVYFIFGAFVRATAKNRIRMSYEIEKMKL